MANLKRLNIEETKEIRTVKNLMTNKEHWTSSKETIKVTEFVTVGEIAIMMDVPVTKVIGTCMSLGIMRLPKTNVWMPKHLPLLPMNLVMKLNSLPLTLKKRFRLLRTKKKI